jgi:phenylalanyl-tRNA synthetase beta chain
MKISINTILALNEHFHTTGDVAAIGTEELLRKIGAQLGAVEEVIAFGDKYKDIIIAKVVSAEKHPNADKLHVCKIDDGNHVKDIERDEGGHIQVVCGAPNVRPGIMVAWLPPGTTVPDTADKEPFVLEARDFRGQLSNGMLASPKELAFGDDHNGILEIDGAFKPGTDFAEAYVLKNELIIDIENKMFTHRPDCFGFLGVARELAGIQDMAFKSPEWYVVNPTFPAIEAEELKLAVKNELPELVPRFTAITLRDVAVGPSPVWLQVYLAKVGQKSINNIVDYTNFYMLETGQPLHAYDYDKVKALSGDDTATIVIRKPNKGEKIALLNGKTIEPRAEAIMIASDKQLIGIGGVMGGAETEVDQHTKNIILECANFNMYSIRRTSMEHGLFTDAVTRFTKGQSPLQNLAVLAKIVNEIREHDGGKVASPVIDTAKVNPAIADYHPSVISIETAFINSRLGLELDAAHIKRILENVEFQVTAEGQSLTVAVPFWRTDIEIMEDIVEEVGRLYGYDKLPLKLPKRDIQPTIKDPMLSIKADARSRLAKAGANEILTYSFVHGNLLDKVGQDQGKAFQVSNALSPDLQYYRLSLMPSLLEKVHANTKAGYNEFALFEIGKTHSIDHSDDEGLPREFEFTGLVVVAADKLKKTGSAYYQARAYLEALVGHDHLTFRPISPDMQEYPVVKPYDLQRSALVSQKDGEFLGIIGEFRPSVTEALKLPKYCAGFEVDTEALGRIMSNKPSYIPLERYPGVKQDMTLKVPAGLPYETLDDFVNKAYGANAIDDTLLFMELVDIYQKPDEADNKHVTFRFVTTGLDRTLTDKEVNKMLDTVAEAARTELGAGRI